MWLLWAAILDFSYPRPQGVQGVLMRLALQPVVSRPASPALGEERKFRSLPVTYRVLKPTYTS